jgi:hypothetical protein
MHHRSTRRWTGLKAAATTAVVVAATLAASPAAHAANPQITVDLGSSQGAVTYGASGSLYALAENGTPTPDKLSGLKVQSIGQMAPGGTQHSDGDANVVAPEFWSQDGQQLQVYVQDYYPTWPYTNPGITSYLNVVTTVVDSVKNEPNADDYVLIPFNEPDWIWYGTSGTLLTNFENDWKTVYQKIRSLWPAAQIAGPSFSQYNASAYQSFFTFAKANDVLPNLTTWHELTDPFTDWYTNYDSYESIQSSLGINIPISINEYGRSSGDMGIPGQMIQYIARFENSRVQANMASWGTIGDIGETLTDGNFSKASAWYLYRWYGERTGNDVAVTLPSLTGSLQATASLSATGTQAYVILGGSSGSTDVVVDGLSATSMGGTVDVAVSTLANSGGSASNGPTTTSQGVYTVSNGQITVTVPNMVAADAYQINVTAGSSSLFDPNQLYEISNVNSGLALEDNDYGTVDGSTVDQWAYSGSDAHMQWYLVPEGDGYYKVVNGYSGKPLDDYDNGTANGSKVDQWEWTGGNNQLWSIANVGGGHYEFLNKASGKALDVYEDSTANGGTVDQWAYSGGNNQLWSISPV